MLKRLPPVLCLVTLLGLPSASANEGYWVPGQLDEGQLSEMTRLGLAVPAEQLGFAMDEEGRQVARLPHAIVQLGTHCTGAFVSDQGLLLTNRHCIYSTLEDLSGGEADYLRDGFLAQSQAEDLPIEGLTVRALIPQLLTCSK
jgi:hypothetical protein